ncbi:hypothetical protein XBP1_1850039 [Xenorhabdus bovienii str. puntauvense]|uniref:Uncharacterized protein n=1 Tax=Xenorhabdus bovienii str. puntauvense TaxID=1398201 RepID=A0A077NAP6_XENBV|nr:hypothetical protein XBFFR1_2620027 [Xenorhabdus bovienii str. feltiae France]CDG92123.1 hypothetical protein XBFFL1_1990025 [Xenorhabdus bovienii str. feltiae Florida]CDG96089.1 hypothetical protein XBP1_1850039 [Xenorhabdus bovienii str. puntauvense]
MFSPLLKHYWGRIIRPNAANAYPASTRGVIIRSSFYKLETNYDP